MKFSIVLSLLLSLNSFAYEDFDMDGVDDAVDKCPNSLLTDLVDINGCTKQSLVTNNHFDIILGVSYSQVDVNTNEKTNNISSSVQIDYYYKQFSLQLATSYFRSKSTSFVNDGQNDSFIAAYYQFRLVQNLNIRFGAGVILPTYKSGLNNNNIDYVGNVSLSYSLDNINIFGGYSYTNVNDDDYYDVNVTTPIIEYQDVNSVYIGLGFYPVDRLYISASYNRSDSIYKDVIAIENAAFYSYYTFSKNWFSTLNYAYGLSDSASNHYVSMRVGYYF